MRRLSLFLLLLYLFPASIRLTVGDPFTLTFSKEVNLPPAFEVLNKEKIPQGYRYTLAIYTPGNYMLKVGDRLISIEVVSVLKGGEGLQEITPPLEVAGNPGWFFLRAGIFLGFLLLIFGGALFYRKFSGRERDPWEELWNRALSLEALAKRGDLDGLYSRMGELLREVLQRRMGIPAQAMTSGELRGKVPQPIEEVLLKADLVRFGGVAVGDPSKDVSLVIETIKEARDEARQA